MRKDNFTKKKTNSYFSIKKIKEIYMYIYVWIIVGTNLLSEGLLNVNHLIPPLLKDSFSTEIHLLLAFSL